MTYLAYINDLLCLETTPLTQIAEEYGTPCYVYSKQALTANWNEFHNAVQNTQQSCKIFYAVKANSNLALLNLLHKLGANFDTVSGGEIERVLKAGAKPQQIVFSGVGKSSAEIKRAIELGIYSIHIESTAELHNVQRIAQELNKQATVAFRINPDVDAKSHPYISTGGKENKFGIDFNRAVENYLLAKDLPNLKIKGISCHIGSQITTLEPFMQTITEIQKLITQLKDNGINLEYIDIGGGLGIRYQDETPPTIAEYVTAVTTKLKSYALEIHFEPGRALVGNIGVLLTKIEYLKSTGINNFAIVDAAMNDLMRPALYASYHEILPVNKNSSALPNIYSVVGPVCESGDFLALHRELAINSGDLIVLKDCGAYGYSMSSNYNTRPRCTEVLVSGDHSYLITKRETLDQLWQNEIIIDEL